MEVSGETGEETPVSEETQRDGGVYRRILSYTGISTGLLKLNLVGTETALLTEIQVLDSAGDNLLGTLLDTSLFDTVTDIPTTTTTGATASGVPPSAGSSSAVTSQPPVPTSVTSDNSTSVATTDAPVGTAVIAAVLSVVVLALLVLLAAVLLAVFLILWRRRRGDKEGYIAAKKESRSAIRQISQSNEMGLYEPITKQNQLDPYYEDPDSLVRVREDKGYSQLIEDEMGVPENKNGAVSMINEFYRGGDDYNIYARPEVSCSADYTRVIRSCP